MWSSNRDPVTRQLLAQDGGGVADLGSGGWGAAPGGGYGAFADSVDSPAGGGHLTQAQMLAEQDRGLDNLHQIVVRQRAIAENIESEVRHFLKFCILPENALWWISEVAG